MPCPDCRVGCYGVIGENKLKVTVNNPVLQKKLQEIVDRNVTLNICYCLNCLKMFVNVNARELVGHYQTKVIVAHISQYFRRN